MPKRSQSPNFATGGKRECSTDQLEFRDTPPIQSVVEATTIVEFPCFTALPKDDGTPLEFRVGKADLYTDLTRTFVGITLQLIDNEGQKLPEDAMVAPINNIGYSFFQNVDLFLNDQKITANDTNYVWSSYVYTLLYNSRNARETVMRGSGWFPDTPGFFNNITKDTDDFENKGFETRRQLFADGKTVHLYNRLFLTTKFDRLIPNQTEIAIKMKPAPNSLSLIASKNEYKIRVLDAKLYVTRLKIIPRHLDMYEHLLNSRKFIYPTLAIQTRCKTVNEGIQNFEWMPFSGQLPQRIYIWQIRQSAYNGQIEQNPYNFVAFGINSLAVFGNGYCLPFSNGMNNMVSDNFLRTYLTSLASINSPETVSIKLDEYTFGYMIIVVDTSADGTSGCSYDNKTENGSLRIAIDYKNPLVEPITVFCMGEMNSEFTIDSNRNVSWSTQ